MPGNHARRKADHIRINLDQDVDFSNLTTGLENYRFVHQALPEMNLDDVDASVTLFGKHLQAPLLISSMTGGTAQAERINLHLAEAAETAGIAMGLGSQRAGLEESEQAATFQVRRVAPNILLFANLGAVQLNKGYTVEHCQRAVDMVEADALILHLNPLQEAVQADGDVHWAGLAKKIEAVCEKLSVPVIASGGVGTLDHLVEGVTQGHASAVLAASIFHYGEHTIGEAKRFMAEAGLPMRLDP